MASAGDRRENPGTGQSILSRNPLQGAVLMREYADVFRLTKPPAVIPKGAFALLAPVGRLLGYRAR